MLSCDRRGGRRCSERRQRDSRRGRWGATWRRAQQLRRQHAPVQGHAVMQNHRVADRIPQLPDISGPGVVGGQGLRVRRNAAKGLALLLGEGFPKGTCDHDHIGAAIPQRRHFDRHDIQTTGQVLAETPLLHRGPYTLKKRQPKVGIPCTNRPTSAYSSETSLSAP